MISAIQWDIAAWIIVTALYSVFDWREYETTENSFRPQTKNIVYCSGIIQHRSSYSIPIRPFAINTNEFDVQPHQSKPIPRTVQRRCEQRQGMLWFKFNCCRWINKFLWRRDGINEAANTSKINILPRNFMLERRIDTTYCEVGAVSARNSKGLIQSHICRQACAIESAALWNPNRDVFILFTTPVGLAKNSTPAIVEALQSYPNIFFRNIDLWTYPMNTSCDDWFLTGQLFRSKYLNTHMSDFLRFITLSKFAGIYLDMDVIVQKSFDNMARNCAAFESEGYIGSSVLHFNDDEIGRRLADMCVKYATSHTNDISHFSSRWFPGVFMTVSMQRSGVKTAQCLSLA